MTSSPRAGFLLSEDGGPCKLGVTKSRTADYIPIEVIRLVGREIKRLDLMDATNRNRVLAVDSNAALDLIFGIANE